MEIYLVRKDPQINYSREKSHGLLILGEASFMVLLISTSNEEGVLSNGFQFLCSTLLFGIAVLCGSQ